MLATCQRGPEMALLLFHIPDSDCRDAQTPASKPASSRPHWHLPSPLHCAKHFNRKPQGKASTEQTLLEPGPAFIHQETGMCLAEEAALIWPESSADKTGCQSELRTELSAQSPHWWDGVPSGRTGEENVMGQPLSDCFPKLCSILFITLQKKKTLSSFYIRENSMTQPC